MILLKKNLAFRTMIIAQLFNNLGTSLFNIVFLMIAASRDLSRYRSRFCHLFAEPICHFTGQFSRQNPQSSTGLVNH